MYPKLVALDTDWTIFSGSLDEHVWGKGRSASRKLSDNIQRVDDWSLRDRSNHDNEIRLNPDVPIIVNDILKNRSSLAIVSRNTSKALCDRALYYFKAMDPNTGEQKSIIQMVRYDEVVDEPKTKHFERIRGWSKFNYTDMILFDHEPENDIVETVLGVPIQVCGDQEGLTWEDYTRGIELWSRIQGIISPYQGQHLQSYPRRKLIGYAALDSALVKLLESGRSIEDQSLARWGYGLYLTDNLAVAKFLRDQMKGAHIKAQVCSIWVRDAELFDTVAKIWVPEDNDLMTDPQSPNGVSTSQLQRDQKIETYGVQKPYVLFSKHQYIDGLPIRKGTRWNEMVVYTHVQNALILAYGMSDKEVANASQNPENASFDTLISEWNITVPEDTLEDFRTHGDTSEPPPPPPAGSTELRIAHFNDVYQVSDQKIQVHHLFTSTMWI
ncbi:hypothetical protein BDN67DRAFT_916690 [Paxillus ammoniavirescens]|nr:hypothetical protein BDN67DRAFT_916690 [Paxillus ammoniavirescens]